MFTGLVEGVGEVLMVPSVDSGGTLRIAAAWLAGQLRLGESIAVDGCCLTVSAHDAGVFEMEVVPETVRCTRLGALAVGAVVNLERALQVGERLGGHLVQGHVDGLVAVTRVETSGTGREIGLTLPVELRRYVAAKGSVALDGVSLTVADVSSGGFRVALVPETLRATTLGRLAIGDELHVEVDVVAKYVERLLGGFAPEAKWGAA